jgi:hypothetical protein
VKPITDRIPESRLRTAELYLYFSTRLDGAVLN